MAAAEHFVRSPVTVATGVRGRVSGGVSVYCVCAMLEQYGCDHPLTTISLPSRVSKMLYTLLFTTRDVRWPKFVGTGTERNAFPFKKDLSLSSFFSFFLFPKTGLSTLSNLSLD